METLAGLIIIGVVVVGVNNLVGLNKASISKQVLRKKNIPTFIEEQDNELFNPMNVGSRFEREQPYTGIENDGPFGITRSERISQPGTFWYDFGNVTTDY